MFWREKPIEVKRRFKKGIFGSIERAVAEIGLRRKGYIVFGEADLKAYNGGKGLLLALIFLPLALLGGSRYVEVTYRLKVAL